MRESVIDSKLTRSGDIFSDAIGGKNMASRLHGLDQAVRDWAISLVPWRASEKLMARSGSPARIPARHATARGVPTPPKR